LSVRQPTGRLTGQLRQAYVGMMNVVLRSLLSQAPTRATPLSLSADPIYTVQTMGQARITALSEFQNRSVHTLLLVII
jgi:hypothetical protein